jgi:hypothetical protein
MFFGFTNGIQTYCNWIGIPNHKNELNVDIQNFRTDVCVVGIFPRIIGGIETCLIYGF